jgi:hypothetical protein
LEVVRLEVAVGGVEAEAALVEVEGQGGLCVCFREGLTYQKGRRKANRGSGWARGASRRGGEAFVYARNAGESNAVWVFMVKIGLLK